METHCKKCGNAFEIKDTYWDETGYGYSTKYTVCPVCGCRVIVAYLEDPGIDVNNDERFYIY